MQSIIVGYYVTQKVDVPDEFDDDREGAEDYALNEVDYPNISNKFEMSGDPEVFSIYNQEGETIYDKFEEELNASRDANSKLADSE